MEIHPTTLTALKRLLKSFLKEEEKYLNVCAKKGLQHELALSDKRYRDISNVLKALENLSVSSNTSLDRALESFLVELNSWKTFNGRKDCLQLFIKFFHRMVGIRDGLEFAYGGRFTENWQEHKAYQVFHEMYRHVHLTIEDELLSQYPNFDKSLGDKHK